MRTHRGRSNRISLVLLKKRGKITKRKYGAEYYEWRNKKLVFANVEQVQTGKHEKQEKVNETTTKKPNLWKQKKTKCNKQ